MSKIPASLRINARAAVVLHDLLMTALAWELAWLARFNFAFPDFTYWEVNVKAVPVVLAAQGLIAWRFGLYGGLWRFASLPDLWNIVRTAVLGGLCITLALFVLNRLEGVPRSLLILYPVFLIFLLGGPRLVFRLWKDNSLSLKTIAGAQRVLIIGAGRGGESVGREMLRDERFVPIGFLDDSAELTNRRIHGIPVIGVIDGVPGLVSELDIDAIFIAIPSATRSQMQRIVHLCEQSGKPFRTLPTLTDLGTDAPKLNKLREVSIDDLLGRDQVRLDWKIIQQGVTTKTVMVSGGGGSIGSELCNQIARLGVAALVIMERSEHNLYTVEMGLRRKYPHLTLHTLLGDVGDRAAVSTAFKRFRPEVIFHAAAHKHVPILEAQAREAVRNNVFGTKVLAEAANRFLCAKFVMISSDKAVNPVSVMGATKRLAEILCATMNEGAHTRFITVRFGNVLGSAGSVVPLFRRQIRAGGPVTVTHRDVSRYFMTIPEACQLILQAGAMGQGGEIFVLDMGEPVKIAYLAEQMIKLSGKIPGQDIKIEFIGLRPGEKLAEELFHTDETLAVTPHAKILLAPQRFGARTYLYEYLRELEDACDRYDDADVRSLLQRVLWSSPIPSQSTAKIVPLRLLDGV